MDDYIQCADLIMAGKASTTVRNSQVGKGLVAKPGRIAVVYREDNIFSS
ncbi:MAG: hypothetical protein AB9897_04635 [Anaerolineaceae bacterium]